MIAERDIFIKALNNVFMITSIHRAVLATNFPRKQACSSIHEFTRGHARAAPISKRRIPRWLAGSRTRRCPRVFALRGTAGALRPDVSTLRGKKACQTVRPRIGTGALRRIVPVSSGSVRRTPVIFRTKGTRGTGCWRFF